MEEIVFEYREMVKKYCTFVNVKLDEALDGKSCHELCRQGRT